MPIITLHCLEHHFLKEWMLNEQNLRQAAWMFYSCSILNLSGCFFFSFWVLSELSGYCLSLLLFLNLSLFISDFVATASEGGERVQLSV